MERCIYSIGITTRISREYYKEILNKYHDYVSEYDVVVFIVDEKIELDDWFIGRLEEQKGFKFIVTNNDETIKNLETRKSSDYWLMASRNSVIIPYSNYMFSYYKANDYKFDKNYVYNIYLIPSNSSAINIVRSYADIEYAFKHPVTFRINAKADFQNYVDEFERLNSNQKHYVQSKGRLLTLLENAACGISLRDIQYRDPQQYFAEHSLNYNKLGELKSMKG